MMANRSDSDGEHHVNDGVEDEVDLRLPVAPAAGPEGDRTHILDGHRRPIGEVGRQSVRERIDIRRMISGGENTDPVEPAAGRAGESIENLLRGPPRIGDKHIEAFDPPKNLALASGKGILKPLEGGIDRGGRVAAPLHGEGGLANRGGGDDDRCAGLGRVRLPGILKEVFDLLDVVAETRTSGAEKCCTHPAILPYVLRRR